MASIKFINIICLCCCLVAVTSTLSDLDFIAIDKCAGVVCAEKCPEDRRLDSLVTNTNFEENLDLVPLVPLSRIKRQLQQLCCTIEDKCPEPPTCQQNETIIELSVGTGQPGNCCTKYACAPEPTCEGAGINYWPDKCTKCNSCQIPNCISIKNCAPPTHASGCHHEDGTQSLNGETWREGICTLCKCENGESHCWPDSCPNEEVAITIATVNATTEGVSSSASTTSVPTLDALDAFDYYNQLINYFIKRQTLDGSTESTTEPSSTTMEEQSTQSTEGSTYQTELPTQQQPAAVELEASSTTEENESSTTMAVETTMMPQDVSSTVASSTVASSTVASSTVVSSTVASSTVATSTSASSTAAESTTPSSTSSPDLLTEFELWQSSSEQPAPQTERSSSSSSEAYFTSTEGPVAFMSPQAPVSINYQRDANVNDIDYHLANEAQRVAPQAYNINLLLQISLFAVALGFVFMLAFIVYKRLTRKGEVYCSVPNSDLNLSEDTNATDMA